MIYGQPITFGGGSGNELVVTAPTGSIVTATKDGKTKTATEDNGTWTFKGLEAGDWTVTATLGSNTKITVVSVVAETLEVTYFKDNFADNSWSDIINACQNGMVPSSWVAGDSKTMTINGTTYNIDIIGKNHDTYTAGGTAPLTFQLHELYATEYQMHDTMTNADGYDGAAMHTTHLPAIKNLMPAEVKAAIKKVNKKTSVGNASSTIETVPCELFLLSEIEVAGKVVSSFAGEGSQYAYYSAGNSEVKLLNGTKNVWWLRSPLQFNDTYFCVIGADGHGTESLEGQVTVAEGVSFAFCF